MAHVAIVYHSGFGHTAVQAHAVERGARAVAGTQVTLLTTEEAEQKLDSLKAADAIIFGAPTYMGSVSAPMKKFMDATSKLWYAQEWKDKLAAGFTNSASWSGDKLNSLVTMFLFSMQHSMMWVGLGLMPGNNNSKGSSEDLNRVGGFSGAMSQSHADLPPEQVPPASDQKTAEHLGRRVAELAARLATSKAA